MTLFMPIDQAKPAVDILDVIGIGFGPSNIAVAIAQKELAPHLTALFLEKRPAFGWHDTMMFPNATMQVNFLKDLVSFRNPRSSFSFVNFLHDNDRLADFTNLQTLFPRRVEFHQYLGWCATKFEDKVTYGADVHEIDRVTMGDDDLYRVRFTTSAGQTERYARSIVHSGGLEPNIPFETCKSDRISHGYHILDSVKDHAEGAHYAVVGGGQSAAEIVQFLYARGAKVSAIVSRFGYMPADDSPFVNQIFDPNQVDHFFSASSETRGKIHDLHAVTNYAGVDGDLLQEIYADWYQDRITGENRLDFNRMCRVTGAMETPDGVRMTLDDALDSTRTEMRADYLICATGFHARSVLGLMSPSLRASAVQDEQQNPVFGRDYSVRLSDTDLSGIYAPHMSEKQHGLTATLLSNMAIRSGEIVQSILQKLETSQTNKSHRVEPQPFVETRELVNG